jgi:uncharacterized protein YidB (DUF937 family)
MIAFLGLLAAAGFQNRDKLAEFVGQFLTPKAQSTGGAAVTNDGTQNAGSGGLAGLGDMFAGGGFGNLGNLLGAGSAGSGGVGGALNELIQHLTANGQGEVAQSWVASGPNQQLSPDQMKQALGPEVVAELAQKMGLDANEIVQRLSAVLPQVVDQLTPSGELQKGQAA